MLNNTILRVTNISKQYRLGTFGTNTIGGDVHRWWTTKVLGNEDPFLKVVKANDRTSKEKSEFVWALKDINFEVKRGEVLGIIGKNGAGKSTLLKLLSRITAPTMGSIESWGRMASLLEVGTGFHPELTGRENIFLNGAILGMTKDEIKRKLDEIIDFSGCALYIDTPVKRYSSGMTVRLGFAVAAFLDPEILIVDEVLAVGDAEFQKKAIGKMRDISKGEGRTVLFVSHNMASVKSLCSKCLLIENGKIKIHSDVENTVQKYLRGTSLYGYTKRFNEWEYSFADFSLKELHVLAVDKVGIDSIDENDTIQIKLELMINSTPDDLQVTYVLKNETGEALFTFSSKHNQPLFNGYNQLICNLPKGFLNIGDYFLDLYIIKNARETIFKESDILTFNVSVGNRPIGSWPGKEPGFIKPIFDWVNNNIN